MYHRALESMPITITTTSPHTQPKPVGNIIVRHHQIIKRPRLPWIAGDPFPGPEKSFSHPSLPDKFSYKKYYRDEIKGMEMAHGRSTTRRKATRYFSDTTVGDSQITYLYAIRNTGACKLLKMYFNSKLIGKDKHIVCLQSSRCIRPPRPMHLISDISDMAHQGILHRRYSIHCIEALYHSLYSFYHIS